MGRNVAIHGFLAAAILFLPTNFAAAETSFKEMFTDPADGAFDMSRFIKTRTGFAGIGKAADGFEALQDAETVWNAGCGFRYLTAREFGLQMGIDVARGPEQWAIYVVFGNSWF